VRQVRAIKGRDPDGRSHWRGMISVRRPS
jgi:hypothetical protein